MKLFKVIFPSGYHILDVYNDNIDLNIVLENEEVFFATFFTLNNIQHLMEKGCETYFWAADMVVVNNLERETIRKAISIIIRDGHTEQIFSKIGTINTVFSTYTSFGNMVDML